MKLNLRNIDKKYIYIARLLICVLGWINIVWVFSVNIELIYTYTIQTNLMVLVWLSISLIFCLKEEKPKILGPFVHGAITLYITVTFFGFAILLTVTAPISFLLSYGNIVPHYIIPIYFIIDWVITEPRGEIKWRFAPYWLIYPLFYFLFTIIRELITTVWVYWFLSITMVGPLVIIFFFVLLGGYLLFIKFYVNINNRPK